MSGSWCRFSIGVLLYVVFVAVACAFGLWLLVLGAVSAGVVLARHRILARRQLPARVAAWALHAPRGLSPPLALEHAIAVDLAAMSQGQLDCLDRAQSVVADSVDDPWRRALAAERLTRAHDLIAGGSVVGVRTRWETPAVRLRDSTWAVVLIGLLALGGLNRARCLMEATSEHASARQRLMEADRLLADAAAARLGKGLRTRLPGILAPAEATPTVPWRPMP